MKTYRLEISHDELTAAMDSIARYSDYLYNEGQQDTISNKTLQRALKTCLRAFSDEVMK